MDKSYKEIIRELELSIKNIESKGISIKPLNDSLSELKKHSENIESIENNIDAIREEVIDRIKRELDENKTAGRFSVFGFWVGAIALILTTFTIFREIVNPTNKYSVGINDTSVTLITLKLNKIDSVLKAISSQNQLNEQRLSTLSIKLLGYDDFYKPDSSELFIPVKLYEKGVKLLLTKDKTIFINCENNTEQTIDYKYKPIVSVSFKLNNINLGLAGLKEIFTIERNSINSRFNEFNNSITLTEGDVFCILKKYKYKVLRIYRTNSNILKVPDTKDGLLLKMIN